MRGINSEQVYYFLKYKFHNKAKIKCHIKRNLTPESSTPMKRQKTITSEGTVIFHYSSTKK